jgi:hypothetical protein
MVTGSCSLYTQRTAARKLAAVLLLAVADVDMDHAVNFTDYAIFADHWMDDTCSDPNWCDGTDFDHSGNVDMLDLATFARYWLSGF